MAEDVAEVDEAREESKEERQEERVEEGVGRSRRGVHVFLNAVRSMRTGVVSRVRGLVESLRLLVEERRRRARERGWEIVLFGGNVRVYRRVRRATLRWLDSVAGIDALQCFFSARGARAVDIVVAPCGVRRYTLLQLPIIARIENAVRQCMDYGACTDPDTGKLYPREWPARKRCMTIWDGDENCHVVIVADSQ